MILYAIVVKKYEEDESITVIHKPRNNQDLVQPGPDPLALLPLSCALCRR